MSDFMSRSSDRLRSPGEGHDRRGPRHQETNMPKYLLLKHYRGGPEPHRPVPPMDQWAPEDVEAHRAFLKHVSGGPPRSPPGRGGGVRISRGGMGFMGAEDPSTSRNHSSRRRGTLL